MTDAQRHVAPSGPVGAPASSKPQTAPETTAIENLRAIMQVHPGQHLSFAIETYTDSQELDNASLLQIIATDERGSRIPIPGWPRVSARVDEYLYLPVADPADPALTRFSVIAPEGSKRIEVVGHRWRAKVATTVVGEIVIFPDDLGVPPFRTELGTRLEWPADAYSEVVDVPADADQLDIDILVSAGQEEAKSPLIFEFLDAHGDALLPPEELPQNPRLGAYLYLKAPAGEQERNQLKVAVPTGVARIRVHGAPWAKRLAQIAEQPTFTFRSLNGIREVLGALLEGYEDSDLIVIDTTAPPLGHETLSLRPNNLSFEYNQAGSSVLFIPFGELRDFPPIIGPGLAQIGRSQAAALIERLIEPRATGSNIYVCSSFPSLECITRAEYLKRNGWRIIYEVRDDMEEFNRVGYSKWYHPLLERKMLSIADVRVTVSEALTRKMVAMGPANARITTVPNGVATATLANSRTLRSAEQLDERNNSNVIGYVGHLTPSWFDWGLLIAAAQQLPEYRFEIIGHGKPSQVQLPPNIEYLGSKSHEELLPHASTWRLGLIPFIPSPLTRGVDPNKIYEYFAWGMRVVTAPMGSVQNYPSTWVYNNLKEFIDSIQEAMSSDMSIDELAKIAQFAEDSAWRHRAATMTQLMKGGIS